MKKNSSREYSFAVCSLFGVIVSVSLFSFLIMPAAAMMYDYKENSALWDLINKANAKANADNDRIPLPQPPYITDNPINRGTYTGPCPIGTDGAPQLRQTGLSSGAECRGACGMDCPDSRCKPLGDWPIKIEGGTCTYKNMTECPAHKGCIDHDACYDYCTEKAGDNSVVFGHCHGLCNGRCYDEYGVVQCSKWADLPVVSSVLGFFTDPPPMDVSLRFSDEPVFSPGSLKVTPTVAVKANTAYQWAILNSMQNSPDCSSWTYYADSRCNGAGWDGTCGQIPSQCVDTSGYRNGLKKEYTFTVVTQIDGNGKTYSVPKVDGWSITYDYAGNIVTAFRWKNGVQSDYCYGVGSRDDVPWDGVGGRDLHLDCEGPDGKSYTRESVSLNDP
jgi:hypothetical protein